MCPIRNTKGSPSGLKEMTQMLTQSDKEEMKSTTKGKYVNK